MNATGVADRMKDNLAGVLNLLRSCIADHSTQIHRGRAPRGWNGLQLLDALGGRIGGNLLLAELLKLSGVKSGSPKARAVAIIPPI